jgi:hypothetical protein
MTDRELKYALDSNSVAGPETGPALFKEQSKSNKDKNRQRQK